MSEESGGSLVGEVRTECCTRTPSKVTRQCHRGWLAVADVENNAHFMDGNESNINFIFLCFRICAEVLPR
jgi:hypothetical protein